MADEPDDPFLWLEDVTGDRALAWVRERNAESTAELTKSDGVPGARGADPLDPRLRRQDPDGLQDRAATTTTSGRTPSTSAGSGGGPPWRSTARPSPPGRP